MEPWPVFASGEDVARSLFLYNIKYFELIAQMAFLLLQINPDARN